MTVEVTFKPEIATTTQEIHHVVETFIKRGVYNITQDGQVTRIPLDAILFITESE